MIPILQPEQHWECPNCNTTAVTRESRPHTQFHHCPGLKGLTAPMIREGEKAKVVSVEREDYIGKEQVRLDGDGRPVMSVITTRNEGEDCTVFAPVASLSTE